MVHHFITRGRPIISAGATDKRTGPADKRTVLHHISEAAAAAEWQPAFRAQIAYGAAQLLVMSCRDSSLVEDLSWDVPAPSPYT